MLLTVFLNPSPLKRRQAVERNCCHWLFAFLRDSDQLAIELESPYVFVFSFLFLFFFFLFFFCAFVVIIILNMDLFWKPQKDGRKMVKLIIFSFPFLFTHMSGCVCFLFVFRNSLLVMSTCKAPPLNSSDCSLNLMKNGHLL